MKFVVLVLSHIRSIYKGKSKRSSQYGRHSPAGRGRAVAWGWGCGRRTARERARERARARARARAAGARAARTLCGGGAAAAGAGRARRATDARAPPSWAAACPPPTARVPRRHYRPAAECSACSRAPSSSSDSPAARCPRRSRSLLRGQNVPFIILSLFELKIKNPVRFASFDKITVSFRLPTRKERLKHNTIILTDNLELNHSHRPR